MKNKARKLIDGQLVDELDEEFSMTISSKCPDKWLFVDLETLNVWHKREDTNGGARPFWRSATKKELKALRLVFYKRA